MKNVCNRAVAILMALVAFSLSSIAMPKGHFMALNASIPVLDSLPAVCLQTQSLNLLSFVRSGTGSFSGPGVSANTFNPTAAGAGRHVLTFQYYDSANQAFAVFRPTLWVHPLNVSIQTNSTCAPSQAIASIADSSVYGVQWFRNNQLIRDKPISYAFIGEALLNGMLYPLDMCVDAQGNRYVVENSGNRVVRFSPGQQNPILVAGGNSHGSALNQLNNPTGIAIDSFGNVFVSDHVNHRIVRWTPGAIQGVVVAGNALGISGSSTNSLNHPYHLKFDSQGRLYVTDRDNNRVIRYPATVRTTSISLTGTVIIGAAGSGSANNQLYAPHSLFIDEVTNKLYVSDDGNARIMRYDLNASNVANTGTRIAGGNGHGTDLNQFLSPIAGIYVLNGEIYLSDKNGHRILRWKEGASSGQVIAGGLGHGEQLFRTSRPTGIRIDSQGNLEYLDQDYGRLVRFDANRLNCDTLAFTEAGVYRAEFKRFGISCVSASADFTINKPIAQISSSRGATVCEGDTTTLSTPAQTGYVYQWYKDGQSIAGANANTFSTSFPGSYTVETGDSNSCFFTSEPFVIHALPQVTLTADGLCLGSQLTTNVPDSNVVQIDWFRNNQLVKQINRKYKEEGEPVLGNFNGWINNIIFQSGIGDVQTLSDGSIYVSDPASHRVLRYLPNAGVFTVVAGGNGGGNGLHQLQTPVGIFVAADGSLYIADRDNHRVVRWLPGASSGTVVAGQTGQLGSSLNKLNSPLDVFLDGANRLYVSDNNNHRVMRWSQGATEGVVVAGTTGVIGSSLNQLYHPYGIFVSENGDLYVADRYNNRVLKYIAGASFAQIVAGGNGAGSNLNQIWEVHGVFVDKSNNVYTTDLYNHRIVRWTPGNAYGEIVARGELYTGAGAYHPHVVTLDDFGRLFVVTGNQRLVRFDLDEMPADTLIAEDAGNYQVKLRTLQGCENISLPLAIFAPVVNLNSSLGFDVCEGDTTILSTAQNSTYTYQWFKDGLQIAGVTASNITAFEPGLYHVEVIDSNACSRISESMLIWPKPQVSIATDGLCYGSELRTNLPDSNVSHIAWYRDGHRIEVVARPHKDTATILLGMINNQWINGIRMPATLRDLLLGPDGAIYFTDSHAVYRYTESIGLVQVAGGSNRGSGLNQLSNPSGLFLQNNAQLYIADAGNHRVVKWTLGDTVGVLMAGVSGQQGSALTHLNLPTKLFLDHQNNLFIADWANNRVVKWNNGANSGQIVAGGNGYGSALNQLTYPEDIFVNGDGSLYVSDVENHRVLKFLPGSLNGQIVAGHGGIGSGLNQFLRPQKIYIDEFENVFVADLWNHRIVRYNHGAISGEIVAGGYGIGDQPYHVPFPKSFAFGTGHSLYVASEQYSMFGSNFSRILRFDLGPNLSSDTLTARLGGAYSAEFTTKFGCKSSSNVIDISEPMLVFPLVNNLCVSDAGLDLNMASPAGGTYYGTGVDTGYFHPAIAGVGSHKIYYLLIDSNGCSKLDSQTIQVVPEPVVSIDTLGSMDLCFGESVTLQSPLVSGQNYQWYRNGVLIPQATQRAYTVRDSVSAQYHVMVTRNVCVKSSDTLSVIVRPKPVVTIANPGASTICQGDIAILQATSDTDVSYQWYRNNVLIAGENGSTISTGLAGSYHSVVLKSNGCGDSSNVLTIQVLPAAVATIDTIVGSLNMCRGESVTLQSPLVSSQTYQWYRNGVLIPQATQRSYTVRDSVSAQYHVMVTRNVCVKSSDTLSVIVRPKPVVTIANPGASTICQGDSVILQAASDTDVSYQWYRNGQLLAGSTQSSLVANQTGNYICQVVKANGCADTSNTLSLTVLDYPIAQITPVNATTVCSGQAVILNANQGTGLTHRWFRNGVLIAGATSASYQATQSGDYTVEVKRQQLCATVSAPVTVVINPLPQISIQVAQGGNFCSGDSIQINAQSTSQVLRYAWFRNGQLLPSDSTGTFFARLPGFYHARVFDTAGCDKASDSVQVGYFDPPFANENICAISVDTLTGRNVVVWEKTANVRTAAYNIYREGVVTGQYINIGRVPFDSMSTFTDTTANPLSQSFRYRIAVVDSCGFESARSVVHRTIHLSSNVGVNNEVNLFWTAYEGVPVPTHRILRSVNGAPFVQIAQVSGTTFTYTDLTPPQGAKNYLIEIEIPGGCSPTGLRTSGQRVSTTFSSIRSNRVAVGQGVFVRNLGWNEPSLYPNPSSGKLYLKLGADLSDHQFEVYDARGRLVRRITVESNEEPHEFDFSMEADGVYTIRSVKSEWKSRFVISK